MFTASFVLNGKDAGKKILAFQLGGLVLKFYKPEMPICLQEVLGQKERFEVNFLSLALPVAAPVKGLEKTSEDIFSLIVDLITLKPLAPITRASLEEGLAIRDWAFDKINRDKVKAVYAEIGGNYYQLRATERNDVWKHLTGHENGPEICFEGFIPLKDLSLNGSPINLTIVTNYDNKFHKIRISNLESI